MAGIRNRDYALLITRLVFGGLMLTHGWPKLMKIINSDWGFADPLGIGAAPSLILTVFAEFFCALAIVLGWKTRLVAIPLIFTMLVAALIIHGSDPLADKEMAILYLGGFAVLAFMGGGRLSIDRK
jgi:putative oxidoreductase